MRRTDLASRSVAQSEPKARPTLIGETLPLISRPVGLFVRGSICLITLPQWAPATQTAAALTATPPQG